MKICYLLTVTDTASAMIHTMAMAWNAVEPKMKKDWEDHNYGGWDFYKQAVHKGCERAARHH